MGLDPITQAISGLVGGTDFKAADALLNKVKSAMNTGINADKSTTDSVKFSNFLNRGKLGAPDLPKSGLGFTKIGFEDLDGDAVPDDYILKIASSSLQVLVIAVMQEKFKFNVTSEWEPFIPFGEGIGGFANELFQGVTGRSLVTRFSSRRIWKGTTPIKFLFNLKFEAIGELEHGKLGSGFRQVVAPVMALSQMVLPSGGPTINVGGLFSGQIPLLVPPGPDPFRDKDKVATAIKGFRGLGLKTNQGEYISATVGNRFVFNNLIVHSAQAEFDSRLDREGFPISAEVALELETYEIYTKQALSDSVV
jgi:hypothetical protein